MNTTIEKKVLIVGAGLAGSEAANFLANRGIKVVLAECKGIKMGPAQSLRTFGELVCTNSLKSKCPNSAHGLLKSEMSKLGSLILEVANNHGVPAGNALAVDRAPFSKEITSRLILHSNIEVIYQEVRDPIQLAQEFGCEYTIVATGPLTTSPLSNWIKDVLTEEDLYFYDAIAPIVEADSLNYSKLYFKDRYEDIEAGKIPDYLNVPLDKEQYESFVQELIKAQKVPTANFEKAKFFEACLPIDIMAARGVETLRFSCMKPVGLETESGQYHHAVLQLRRENLEGEAYNLVGFQNRLTYGEQKRVFRMLPGFAEANFLHLGSVHRNTFLNAKKMLNVDFSSREFPRLYFAGQITGVEGYTESAAMGLYVACQIYQKISGNFMEKFPKETAMGALINYIFSVEKPRPSSINFGLLPPVALTKEQRKNRKTRKKIKKELAAEKARQVFDSFIKGVNL